MLKNIRICVAALAILFMGIISCNKHGEIQVVVEDNEVEPVKNDTLVIETDNLEKIVEQQVALEKKLLFALIKDSVRAF